MSLFQMKIIEEAYTFSLKVEEKLRNKFDKKNSGRGRNGRSGI